jgi:hypothetical protein
MIGAAVLTLGKAHAPVTLAAATRLEGSNRVRLQVCNDAPGRVRLYAVEMWAQSGTNWILGGEVHLDYTRTSGWEGAQHAHSPEIP